MKFKNYLGLLFLFIFSYAGAQTLEINGKITDSKSNLPLPGVNVIVKNLKTGTTTDFDGNYSIKVNQNDVLVFSSLSYTKQEIKIEKAQQLNVQLSEESNSLEEVVVIGYGTQKKSVVTGAISSVKAKDLEKIPAGRIEQALQGRVSGVTIATNSGQPGSASTIRVRGITTFDQFGGNNPLWVVDGVIVDSGGIGYVNQSDIESVEVLKDAASLAIYGARAASGVILVSTKKGKKGKISVNYTGFTGSSSPEKKLQLLNATQYGALMNERFAAGGQPGSIPYPNLSALGLGTDWQSVIFNNNAKRVSHEVNFGGGNDISNFYVSFGLQDQEGIVATDISNFTKKNIRLNSTHKITDKLTFSQNLGYAHQKSTGVGNTNSEFGGVLSSAINLDPITPIVEMDPTLANNTGLYPLSAIRDSNGNPYGISAVVGQEMTNPLAYTKTRLGNYNWSDDFVGNGSLEYAPNKHFKFKSTVGAKIAYWGGEAFTPVFYLNASTSTLQNNLSRNSNKAFGWNIENTMTYTRSINLHNINLLFGQAAYVDNISSGSTVIHTNLPVNTYQEASFNFDIPNAQKFGYAYTGVEHRVSSLFSRLNYDYNEKYLFTGIIRRDGSSRFGPNNKFGVFPSFSAGWVVSKEGFWKDNKFVNTLKVRAGYGITGNDAIGNFGYLATIGGSRDYSIGTPGAITPGSSPNAPSNPDLKWEQTAQTNIGIDTKIFNDFNVTFEYYNKKTTGILQYVDLPGYVGATGSPFGNVADMKNSGLEFELGYRKKIRGVNFSANGNISTLKNEVTFLGQGKEFITNGTAGFQSMGAITRTQVGQAYNSFYGFQTAGIFQNTAEVNAYTNAAGSLIQPNAVPGDFRWVDTDGDGSITDKDKKFLGSPIPKYTFGLTLNFDYKGFDLMIFTQGVSGNKIFQGLRRLDVDKANYQTVAMSRWTGDGTSNDFPRLTSNDTNGNFGNMSNFYLENGDYLRLKVVQLGYSLPSALINKIGAQKVRLYVTGENLLTLTKYSGFDPEIGGDVMGVDRGYYPQARSFMLGANLQF